MTKAKILITGANGFVGTALLTQARRQGYNTTAITRRPLSGNPDCENLLLDQLDQHTDWRPILAEAKPDVIIHTAARVHQMHDTAEDPLSACRSVNTAGTLKLAQQAMDAGVKRFIFISTIKVNGEQTTPSHKFTAEDIMQPADPYGVSKAEAEAALWQLVAGSTMELTIIRPPLVYGPGVKGNFAAMMRMASKNLPLPLGAINNKRSLVALDNLISVIVSCISHPKAANQTFLVSDDQDVSTTELLTLLTQAAGHKPRLIPLPVRWLRLAGKLCAKQALIERLCGNLQLDISHTRQQLGWQPVITVEDAIKKCFSKGV
jgi:UDP-glucose 4-epimerase